MNYNAKHSDGSHGGIRRIQRVSDVNAMGYPATQPSNAFVPNTFPTETYSGSGSTTTTSSIGSAAYNYGDQQNTFNMNQNPNPTFAPNYANQPPGAVPYPSYGGGGGGGAGAGPYSNPAPQYGQQPPLNAGVPYPPNQFNPPNPAAAAAPPGAPNTFSGQFSMLQQPMVQDMALQYGQRLADQGKQLVESQFEKYVPVTRLKYYFAVDNNYVVKKLILLLFPFTHRDWSSKYDQDNPVQPRYDLNAPDLYIPTMAYITFVVLAGLVMGMQNQFTPEQLGVISSSALAYSIFELIVYSITLYVSNITASMKTLDLLAFSGYKFVTINLCIVISIVFKRFGYYLALLYTSISLCFFLLRTLKAKILRETTSTASYDAYGNVQQTDVHTDYTVGRKRKLYFLFLISFAQPILSFFLSMHLIPSKTVDAAVTL